MRELVHWKKNLFLLPNGKARKYLIEEKSRLLNSCTNGSAIKDIAFKIIMIMTNLLPEKPSKIFKAKDHMLALERRITDWFNGDIINLLHKRETIQRGLKNPNKRQDNKIS